MCRKDLEPLSSIGPGTDTANGNRQRKVNDRSKDREGWGVTLPKGYMSNILLCEG